MLLLRRPLRDDSGHTLSEGEALGGLATEGDPGEIPMGSWELLREGRSRADRVRTGGLPCLEAAAELGS